MQNSLLYATLALAFAPMLSYGFVLTGPAPSRPGTPLRLIAPVELRAQTGEQIFSAHCAVCHAGGQNAIVTQRTLEKTAIDKYLFGGFNEKAVAYQVTHGRNAMPVFAERLSEAEVAVVAAYVIKSAADGWDGGD